MSTYKSLNHYNISRNILYYYLRDNQGVSKMLNFSSKISHNNEQNHQHFCPTDNRAQLLQKKKSKMDFLPIPKGSWQEDYDRRNKKYNKQLLIATGYFLFSLFCMNKNGFVKGYEYVELF